VLQRLFISFEDADSHVASVASLEFSSLVKLCRRHDVRPAAEIFSALFAPSPSNSATALHRNS
jgi:hypothetical protein